MPSRPRQRGISLVLVTTGMLALIAIAGVLVMDAGMAYLAKTRMQNALDAAALAGAKKLFVGYGAGDAVSEANAIYATNIAVAAGTADISAAPVVQTSATLDPWPTAAGAQRFVRVSATLPVNTWFGGLLGLDPQMNIGGSATAGPIGVGPHVCGAIPVLFCGTPDGDTDCTDGSCYGITGVGSESLHTITGKNNGLTSGNYGFLDMSCGTGGNCLRRDLAGGEDICFTLGATVPTEPGIKAGPVEDGINARFGDYGGPLSMAEFPPDKVTTENIFYAEYQRRLDAHAYDFSNGKPQRRVVLVPVGDCSTPVNGRTDVNVLGAVCMFLTQKVDGSGDITGQFIRMCRGEGDIPDDPAAQGPMQVILYQSSGSS